MILPSRNVNSYYQAEMLIFRVDLKVISAIISSFLYGKEDIAGERKQVISYHERHKKI